MIFETIEENNTARNNNILVKYNNSVQHEIKPKKHVSAHKSVLSQYHDLGLERQPYHSNLLWTWLFKQPFVFGPSPKLMRQYEPIGSHRLAKNGSNLSAVLFDFSGYDEGRQILERLLGWIRQLPNEPYQDFDFDMT